MSHDDDPFGADLGLCRVVAKTTLAILVRTEDYGQQWVPLSNVHDDSELYDDSKRGDEGKLVVKSWFAEQKGWA